PVYFKKEQKFLQTARDDTMFTSMRCISKHEKTQVYGAILPKKLTNQAMLESKAYKTYYAFPCGEKTSKPKYIRKKADFDTSPKQRPVQATKCTRIKTKAKVAISDKKKQLANMPKAKGLDVLSKSKVLDEQQQKTFSTNEETGTIPRVPDVPIYDSKSDKESWGDSNEEDDDEDDFEDDADNNDDDNDDNDESDDERMKSDRDEIHDPNLINVDQTEHEEEYFNERVHTPSDYELTVTTVT
nr:hypothetical protein [Tanacetum cinerariifolium]